MSSSDDGRLMPETITAAAQRELEAFQARVAKVPYERKGILYSEMFFLYLCSRYAKPGRILESGRARGQSTLLLAVCFPDLPIVSLEHDAASADVPVAAERLRLLRNVELRFGDATRVLPSVASPGDVVLIDGPKGFRAIRLALSLLSQGLVSMVFIHDMTRGTPERRFLERHVPSALYSDDGVFGRIAHRLDAAVEDIPQALRGGEGSGGHGYGLACLPRIAGARYRQAWIAAVLAGLAARVDG